MDMNIPEKPESGTPSAGFDPFPEPNTFPKKYDLGSILNPDPSQEEDPEPMPTWYEKFREPRTCPPGWGL